MRNVIDMEISTEKKGDFMISTDKSELDVKVIHDFFANRSYWSENIQL